MSIKILPDSGTGGGGAPSGPAGGDLGGTYPNPNVNALHSATTSVNVSSATAPTSGQVLTATSGTAATWQTPASGTSVFLDGAFAVENTADNTKVLNTDLSGLTTGKTVTLKPLSTANTTFNIRPNVDASANIITQNATSQQIFIGADSSIGGANSGLQYSSDAAANRGQIRVGSYFNGTSVAGVTTATSRSGTIGVNAAVVNGQDYSKWTAQAGATTAGSLPISGAFAFKANTVNSLTVTSDWHLQLTNLAGTLGDKLYVTSEGLLGVNTSAPKAVLDVNGSSAFKVASKTANYTAADTETVILCDATGGAFAITLPAAASSTNKTYTVKKKDASANAVTLTGNGAETIDGSNTQALSTQYSSLTVVCDGSAWFIV